MIIIKNGVFASITVATCVCVHAWLTVTMCGVCALRSKEKLIFILFVYAFTSLALISYLNKPCTMPCAWGKKLITLPLNCSKYSSEGFHIMIQVDISPIKPDSYACHFAPEEAQRVKLCT